jgi:hypothetical protein
MILPDTVKSTNRQSLSFRRQLVAAGERESEPMNTVKKLAAGLAVLAAVGVGTPAVAYADDQPGNVGGSGATGAAGAPHSGGSTSSSTRDPSNVGGAQQLRDLFERLFPSLFR